MSPPCPDPPGILWESARLPEKSSMTSRPIPRNESNLADQDPKDHGERLEGFREQMHAYLDEARRLEAQRGGQEILLDSETEEKLRKLGYTTH